MTKKIWYAGTAGALLVVLLAMSRPAISAPQNSGEAVRIDSDDIGGVVASTKGPEAGVWVIAETKDLPTGFRKIVVTDERGRYVVPDLPKANYEVWVRGYGLVDSPKVQTTPGKILNLKAVVAPNAHAAAQYYPASYWYSLLQIPPKSDFPGTGPDGNGISDGMKSQAEWIKYVKTDGCESCHQLGDKATREIPKSLGVFDSSVEAWDRRVKSAQDGIIMTGVMARMGRKRALKMFADWTDRVAHGELPPAPPRPQGVERNVVITQWDWADPKEYFHDVISTDRRNPTVNANGPVYGVHENSSDFMTVVDPVHNTMTQVPFPVRDPNTPYSEPRGMLEPSAYWGKEPIFSSKANAHSLVMDGQGRVWVASAIRPPTDPDYCGQGSKLPSAMLFPLKTSNRQASFYDPRTKQFTLIDTCFNTQHLQFAEDPNNTLWFSEGVAGASVVGWLNTKLFDQTHDEQKSQGWTAVILDTNGNGKRDAYVAADQPIDPTKDKEIHAPFYGVNPSPVDGSIWGSVLGFPGGLVRLSPGSNPPETTLAEFYEVPWNNPKAPVQGFSPRGLDIDRNGVVWTVLASGHLASFDRRKCKGPLNGPKATGQQCPEGWTLYPTPGPNFKGITASGSADSNYYDWVDQFNTFGLGKNVPIATGNGSDSLEALLPDSGKWVVLRVPYPMGFFAKNIDGRIDDSNAGWKGKGLWSTYATRAPWHMEGGKGTTSKVVKFQLRPNPLAN
jgi:hypothetical protein